MARAADSEKTSEPIGRAGVEPDEFTIGAGHVRRLHDVFVPAALQSDVGLCAIGEFRCREAEPGVSPATEILDFRRADGVVI